MKNALDFCLADWLPVLTRLGGGPSSDVREIEIFSLHLFLQTTQVCVFFLLASGDTPEPEAGKTP